MEKKINNNKNNNNNKTNNLLIIIILIVTIIIIIISIIIDGFDSFLQTVLTLATVGRACSDTYTTDSLQEALKPQAFIVNTNPADCIHEVCAAWVASLCCTCCR